MKRKRQDAGEERRRERVEINLVAEEESGRVPILKRGRGCALPFGLLVLAAFAILAAHAGVNAF